MLAVKLETKGFGNSAEALEANVFGINPPFIYFSNQFLPFHKNIHAPFVPTSNAEAINALDAKIIDGMRRGTRLRANTNQTASYPQCII